MSSWSIRGGVRQSWLAPVAGLLALGLVAVVVFSVSGSGDYSVGGLISGDNAAPGIESLLHGSVAGYLAHQPLMGLTTILWRLPFAALASVLGGGELSVYRLGVFACMVPLVFGAAWLIGAPGLSLKQRLLRLLTLGIVIQSSILRSAVELGHPEDVLAAVLATGAVLQATSGRVRWAAVLLGVAIGAKQWAVIAVVPVMLALPGRRLEVAAIAAGLAAVLCGAAAVADPAAFERSINAQRDIYLSPLSPLWPLARPPQFLGNADTVATRLIPGGLTRFGAGSIQIAAALCVGGVWYTRLRRRGMTCDPVCLLVLLGALRCICDTADWPYYWLAVVIPAAAWELTEHRFPVVTLLVSLTVWGLFDGIGRVPSNLIYVVAVGSSAGLIVYLARCSAIATGSGAAPTTPGVHLISQAAEHISRR